MSKPVKDIHEVYFTAARTPGKEVAWGRVQSEQAPGNMIDIRTSHIVSKDLANGKFETLNTVYVIKSEYKQP